MRTMSPSTQFTEGKWSCCQVTDVTVCVRIMFEIKLLFVAMHFRDQSQVSQQLYYTVVVLWAATTTAVRLYSPLLLTGNCYWNRAKCTAAESISCLQTANYSKCNAIQREFYYYNFILPTQALFCTDSLPLYWFPWLSTKTLLCNCYFVAI